MNAISRPEYYVVPDRHPGNCRCSKHGLKVSPQAPSIAPLQDAGRQGASDSATHHQTVPVSGVVAL